MDARALLINGEQVPAANGRTTEDLSPTDGSVIATLAAASPEDVTKAVDAADAAFAAWSATAPSQRRQILFRAGDLLEERAEAAAELMARETGGTFGWSLFNVGLAANMFREAAGLATAPIGDVLATDNPDALSLAVRQPAGVVAAFAPWNAPLILGTRAVAGPLAVGNTVVVKASEDAPLACALFLADILHDAGLPPGVLNVITNDRGDGAAIAETLIGDSRVRRVNFTGSTATGRRIAELAARSLTPVLLELGGKNSVLVLDDADLDYAVEAASFGAYLNSGQVCMSADRILVHRAVADEFAARLAEKAKRLPAGDPTDRSVVIGPLINADAARRVASLVDEAAGAGARVLAGGGAPDGAHYPATVLAGVTPRMRDPHRGDIRSGVYGADGRRRGRGGRGGQRQPVRPDRGRGDRRSAAWHGGGPPAAHRHRARQRPVGGRRADGAVRRRRGLGVRPVRRPGGAGRVHRPALDHAPAAPEALPVLSMARIVALRDAVAELVHDGDTVALEGFTHLIPVAAGHEIIRQGRRELTLVRMTPDLVYDQLIGAGCAAQADLLVGRQPRGRLAAPVPRRRGARLAGAAGDRGAQPRRHGQPLRRRARPACRSRCCAATSAPTCPRQTRTIAAITCPFTGEVLTAVPALNPDVAIVHAQRADREGNVQLWGITGVQKEAVLAAGARWSPSRRSSTSSTRVPGAVVLPGWAVTAVAAVPGGAHPSYAQGYYDRDNDYYQRVGRDQPGPGAFRRVARLAVIQ